MLRYSGLLDTSLANSLIEFGNTGLPIGGGSCKWVVLWSDLYNLIIWPHISAHDSSLSLISLLLFLSSERARRIRSVSNSFIGEDRRLNRDGI